MRNPLIKRLPRELKSEFGKYLVLFVFIAGMIGIISGLEVASGSMAAAYDEGFEKYNIEDGNFELAYKADDALIDTLEKEELTVYENFYAEESTKEVDSTLRIFINREEVNKVCLMEGELPESAEEIAIDRMYADNNELSVGDTLTAGDKALTITGLVALSDYQALYSDPGDMMFDAMKFGVAVMTKEGFDSFGESSLHYSYSWIYDNEPADDIEAKEMSEDFLKVLAANAVVTNYIPAYINQAIIFAGDDIKSDNTFCSVFLYIVIIIIAFIFAITTASTVAKEAAVIGTLRASGYTKGELIRHYLTMPMAVTLAAAIVGNVLGYTIIKDIGADIYYGSYSLPTYTTLWNASAFVKTTVVPLIIMFIINLSILVNKLNISPLNFLRRDLSRRKKKKAFRLNTKIGIMKRFRLRIVFQNLSNYITIFIGIFFANAILMFGLVWTPLLESYEVSITENMICDYQYILKAPVETETEGAEKYAAASLQTIEGRLPAEGVTIYGIIPDSKYIDLEFDGSKVFISNAYAEKHRVSEGDTVTLKEKYGDKEYTFEVGGIYYYPASIAIFMSQDALCEVFDYDSGYFSGYFSDSEITDIDELYISTKITLEDLTKTSRQLTLSMGDMMSIFLVFGVVMFMLIIYLLSKLIIEKNTQSISMTKILGYTNSEISGLYIVTTSIVVIASLILTLPLVNYAIAKIFEWAFGQYAGWLPYTTDFTVFVKIVILGIVAYAVIAFMQMRKVKKIPLSEALKNVE